MPAPRAGARLRPYRVADPARTRASTTPPHPPDAASRVSQSAGGGAPPPRVVTARTGVHGERPPEAGAPPPAGRGRAGEPAAAAADACLRDLLAALGTKPVRDADVALVASLVANAAAGAPLTREQRAFVRAMPDAAAPRPDAAAPRAAVAALRARLDLSAREAEVVWLMAAGCTDVETGRRLAIRPDTVRRHLARALRKTGTGLRERLRALVGSIAGASAP